MKKQIKTTTVICNLKTKAKKKKAVKQPAEPQIEEAPPQQQPLPTPSHRFATVHEGPARLRKGDVINLFRQKHIVIMVNQSRALCVPMSRRAVSYETVLGQKVEFTKADNGTAISPNAEVDILERGGQAALDAFMHPKAQEPKAKQDKPKQDRQPRGESKCAYIDSLLEKGKHTFTQIAKLACEKFGSDPKSTMNTVRARPSHMRKAGKTPKWIAE